MSLLRRLADREGLGISAVSVLEVQAGVKAGEEARTDAFLSHYHMTELRLHREERDQ